MRFRIPLVAEAALVLAAGALLLVLIAFDYRGSANLLGILRLILGLFFVLIVPGYYVHLALFPETTHLDLPERFVLSLVISLALLPLLLLLLDIFLLPLDTRTITLMQATLIGISGAASYWRRWRQPLATRFLLPVSTGTPGWWHGQSRQVKLLIALILTMFLIVMGAGLLIITQPGPIERFTEFYIVGPRGLAQDFPREVQVGEPISVVVGVSNREGSAVLYWVEVSIADVIVTASEPFELAHGDATERAITFTTVQPGEDVEVRFWLYREDRLEPYRSARLWMTVSG
ncbi:MAG: DUF1616 domain-containing protein [Chloroflexi bacterium]|nr:DUF1616 domain-containing protein [Chloroflexota bacterium]